MAAPVELMTWPVVGCVEGMCVLVRETEAVILVMYEM